MNKKIAAFAIAAVIAVGACSTLLAACGSGDGEKLDSYVQSTTEYMNQFTGKGNSSAQKLAAMNYVSEVGNAKTLKDAQSKFETARTEIAKGFVPKYDSEAELKKRMQNIAGEGEEPNYVLYYNDLAASILGNLAPVFGGGRASFSAGEIVSETVTDYTGRGIFTAEEFEKINALEDADLKAKMLKVDSINDLYRSSVVSFTSTWGFALTNHYTQLGCDYFNTVYGKDYVVNQEYFVLGKASISETPIEGTNDYKITVETDERAPEAIREDGTFEFVFNASTGLASRVNHIFARIPYAVVSEAANSTGGIDSPTEHTVNDTYVLSQGVTIQTIKYGNRTMKPIEERNDDNKDQFDIEAADPTVITTRETFTLYVPKQEIIDAHKAQGNGVVMMIHGGSWTSGDKSSLYTYARDWVLKGYFVMTVNHTYALRYYDNGDVVTFLDIQNELDQAMAKLKELSDEKGWNINKAATHGYSSGSHLAAWYAYDKGNRADAPIPVVCTFSMVGSMTFHNNAWLDVGPLGQQLAVLGLNDPKMCEIAEDNPRRDELQAALDAVAAGTKDRSELNEYDYTTYSKEEYDAKIDSLSPLSFVKKGDCVPTVLAEACQDNLLISATNGYLMDEALNAAGVDHDVIIFPNTEHLGAGNAECGNVYRKASWDMVKKYFGY